MTYNNKFGFTVTELIALIIVLTVFWFCFEFGGRLIAGLLSDYKDQQWAGLLVILGGILSGALLVTILVGSSYVIGMILHKRKKGK